MSNEDKDKEIEILKANAILLKERIKQLQNTTIYLLRKLHDSNDKLIPDLIQRVDDIIELSDVIVHGTHYSREIWNKVIGWQEAIAELQRYLKSYIESPYT